MLKSTFPHLILYSTIYYCRIGSFHTSFLYLFSKIYIQYGVIKIPDIHPIPFCNRALFSLSVKPHSINLVIVTPWRLLMNVMKCPSSAQTPVTLIYMYIWQTVQVSIYGIFCGIGYFSCIGIHVHVEQIKKKVTSVLFCRRMIAPPLGIRDRSSQKSVSCSLCVSEIHSGVRCIDVCALTDYTWIRYIFWIHRNGAYIIILIDLYDYQSYLCKGDQN